MSFSSSLMHNFYNPYCYIQCLSKKYLSTFIHDLQNLKILQITCSRKGCLCNLFRPDTVSSEVQYWKILGSFFNIISVQSAYHDVTLYETNECYITLILRRKKSKKTRKPRCQSSWKWVSKKQDHRRQSDGVWHRFKKNL